ncbi:hypothetical protein ACFXG6_05085 [Streptomyces roseus]|uniref:hypothetical protein n=1 Tax=Streptomyces roseus TaxID=66430 RepID=UPI00369E0AAE
MTDATTAAAPEPEIASLHHLCRVLAEAAEAVGEASRYASELALGARLPRQARGGGARRALLRTITDPKGLGWAPRGRGLARIGRLAGVFTSRESLAVSLAVTGLKARIRAASVAHPELLADPDSVRVLGAVQADRQREAVRVLRSLLAAKGAERTFARLAPVFADLLAWNALTDEKPFNDGAGWEIATGRTVTGAEPLVPSPALAERLDTSGTIAGYVRNIGAVGTDGTLLVQQVVGPDGVQRYVVRLAGMSGVSGKSPQDLLGAVHAVARPATPYSRAVAQALRGLIPSGCELAPVGHSLGGITAMNLAADRDFCGIHQVTHVVAIGSPVDGKRPADPRTRVYSLVNEHDVVPALEGRSPSPRTRCPDSSPSSPGPTTRTPSRSAMPPRGTRTTSNTRSPRRARAWTANSPPSGAG